MRSGRLEAEVARGAYVTADDMSRLLADRRMRESRPG